MMLLSNRPKALVNSPKAPGRSGISITRRTKRLPRTKPRCSREERIIMSMLPPETTTATRLPLKRAALAVNAAKAAGSSAFGHRLLDLQQRKDALFDGNLRDLEEAVHVGGNQGPTALAGAFHGDALRNRSKLAGMVAVKAVKTVVGGLKRSICTP